MGNVESSPEDPKAAYRAKSFPGSAIVDSLVSPCGNLRDTDDGASPKNSQRGITRFLNQAETLCVQSPSSDTGKGDFSRFNDEYEDFRKDRDVDDDHSVEDRLRPPTSPANPTSALFARALISEVTDNPKTMTPAAMAERERKLLKAQERARLAKKTGDQSRPVGAPGGVGTPSVLGSIAHALTGTTDPLAAAQAQAQGIKASVLPPNMMSEKRAQVDSNGSNGDVVLGKHTITIGLSLSRRSSVGHPDTVTRQTAFDFNELQDREYKYVSSTDSSGWRAGGGERGGPVSPDMSTVSDGAEENELGVNVKPFGTGAGTPTGAAHKAAAPDTVHIPIIHIDAESPQAIDEIIAALARGEVFIPHMAVMPESLSVDGVSPPDLVVRFGTERNEDLPPEEWPNWCLEFMHNQLYEYFHGMGARWMKRPFSITLARKVRWKTVKHMNRYFAHAERVIDAWRERGPQYLDPQLAYIEGGATPEEVARPHGIYLLRNGIPTNYFAPNFDPPYTTKMTRSLLMNVMGKSWDKKRREWTSEPIPRLLTPGMLVTAMCGCTDSNAGGFIANEVTLKNRIDTSSIPMDAVIRSEEPGPSKRQSSVPKQSQPEQQQPKQYNQQIPAPKLQPQTPAGTEAADTDILSEAVAQALPAHLKDFERTPKEFSKYDEEVVPASSASNGPTSPRSYQPLDLHVSSSSADHDSQASSPVQTPRHDSVASPEQKLLSSPPSAKTDKYNIPEDPPVQESMVDMSMDNTGTSDFVQPSVTNTNSTIMHMNLSAEQFMKRELNRRAGREEKKEDPESLASDDDWLDNLGKPVASAALHSQTTTAEKDKVKEALEKERARQIALVAMAHEQASKVSNNDSTKTESTKSVSKADKFNRLSPGINKNNSGVSLEYSVDSASFLGGDGSTLGGGSSLLGGRYATDGSVATASTKGTWSNTMNKKDPLSLSSTGRFAREDDEASGFSIHESTTSGSEVVPSDEDLFAVGWAKALDPKSGSFYYFTLDRTKIVWDNPLASRGASTDSTETGSIPEGPVVI